MAYSDYWDEKQLSVMFSVLISSLELIPRKELCDGPCLLHQLARRRRSCNFLHGQSDARLSSVGVTGGTQEPTLQGLDKAYR
jgi:hypothetical protein